MGTEYVLSWQATLAVFIVVNVILWFMSALFKCPRIVCLLVAAGITAAAKYYWWWVAAQVSAWARFMGLEV